MSFKTKDCKLWLIHFSLAELFFALTVVTLKRRIIWALFGISLLVWWLDFLLVK